MNCSGFVTYEEMKNPLRFFTADETKNFEGILQVKRRRTIKSYAQLTRYEIKGRRTR